MDNFVVSARKYRPSTFESVVGQSSITVTLKNSIKNNHLAHAYLFCGPRGVGKTTCARIFAKTINCRNLTPEFEPCNVCEECMSFNGNRSYNIHELDAASNNSVEDIRQINEQVRIPPQIGKYSVYIIDEVHMLSASAFNAFLKTLEEPPSHAIFILATTEKHKIIPTILSRCQIFDFNRIKIDDMVKHLQYVASKEMVTASSDALNVIAQKSEGAMRDALSFFDQIVSFSGNNISYEDAISHLNVLDYDYYFKVVDCFLKQNVTDCLLIFDSILDFGFDGHIFISGLAEHFRDLLVSKDSATISLLEVGEGTKERYKLQSAQCEKDFIFSALKICSNCDIYYKSSKNQRLHVELALIQLCNLIQGEKKNDTVIQPTLNKQETSAQKANNPVVTPQNITVGSQKLQPPKTEPVKTASTLQSSISIKDAKNKLSQEPKVKEVKEEIVEEILNENFDLESLQQKWKSFAETIKPDKTRAYNTLTAVVPELKDNFVVELKLNSESQCEAVKDVSMELLKYLKKELRNSSVSLQTTVIAGEARNDKKLYTDTDKFNYLNEKNPSLSLLQKTLNLDFK